MKETIAESGAGIDIGHVHGYGMQSVHPTVSITWPNGTKILYGPVTPKRCSDVIQETQDGPSSHLKDLVIGQINGEPGQIRSIRDHPFFSCEPNERRLLANLGITDPDSLNHAIATGSYKATARIIGRRMQLDSRAGVELHFPLGLSGIFLQEPKEMIIMWYAMLTKEILERG